MLWARYLCTVGFIGLWGPLAYYYYVHKVYHTAGCMFFVVCFDFALLGLLIVFCFASQRTRSMRRTSGCSSSLMSRGMALRRSISRT